MDVRFALLLACFFLSGFAALLYQTAWTRELSFVFGTSELAVAAVLAAYMGGLALGASAAARYAQRLRRPVLAYGVLELAIAVSALSVPAGIRLINSMYIGLLGGGELPEGASTATALFQLAAAFAVLLPPTAFMGATLPLLARHAVRNEAEIGSRVGVLYAVNTAGAIAGTLCAAFWLMPELGLRRTVWGGAALNGLVFALAALLARGAANPPSVSPRASTGPIVDGSGWILPAIALSGAVSFAYEVLWTRLLGHLLGASLDAFATMLASFLLGITLGSGFAARLATTRGRAVLGFGLAQVGIAITSYSAFLFANRLPEFSMNLGAGPGAPLANAGLAAAVLLPITLCIGATFPFAVRLLAQSAEQAAAATARTYAWNTLGAIVGALGAGFVLLPVLGFAGALCVGVAANLGIAALTALMARPRRRGFAAIAAAAGLAVFIWPAPTPWSLLSWSPLTKRPKPGRLVFADVGRSSTVLLLDQGSRFLLSSNGLPEAMIERAGVRPRISVAYTLGLFPFLMRPEAQSLLVVGLGGGLALEPVPASVESIDVIELEPSVLTANQLVANERAIDPLANPAVRVHLGDARGAMQLTGKRYDAVVSQPSHPWTAGASHLYTQEFFSLARSRLKPGGVFVQWIGLSFVDEALLRSLAATLLSAFEYVEVYQPGASIGVLFAASDQPLDSLEGARRAMSAAPMDYRRFGFHRVEDFAAVRVLDDVGTRALAEGGELNTDDHNHIASRASRLGEAALDSDSFRMLVKDHDPLFVAGDELDGLAVIRRLVVTNFHERATALAHSWEGARKEGGLGWTELGFGHPGRATRHFARALELEPTSRDSLAGLVASRRADFMEGIPVAGITEQDLDVELSRMIAAWRHATANEWDALAALDGELGRIGAGEAFFEEASRLRARWRIAAEEPEAGAEALAILDDLLTWSWKPRDALLRARAAIVAEQPEAAWGSLSRIADLPRTSDWTKTLIAQAYEIAEALPEERDRGLRARLQ